MRFFEKLLCRVLGHSLTEDASGVEDVYCERCREYFGMETRLGIKVSPEQYDRWLGF